jgi:hypothetical protein
MRRRKIKSRTRYQRPRRFIDAETGPEDDPDRDEPINGCGQEEGK